MAITEQTRTELAAIAERYPQARSGLIPMLHLVQSAEGYVSPEGLREVAAILNLTVADVAAVATFYTMFKMRPVGEHHVAVCVNPMCGVLGGDRIWEVLSAELGVGPGGTTDDGKVTLERIECQAACTNAPVMTVDWEFMDNMSVDRARDVVSRLRAGESVRSTRGPLIRSFRDTERSLSGIEDDGLADEGGNNASATMLAGLRVARERGMVSPDGRPPAPIRAKESGAKAPGSKPGEVK